MLINWGSWLKFIKTEGYERMHTDSDSKALQDPGAPFGLELLSARPLFSSLSAVLLLPVLWIPFSPAASGLPSGCDFWAFTFSLATFSIFKERHMLLIFRHTGVRGTPPTKASQEEKLNHFYPCGIKNYFSYKKTDKQINNPPLILLQIKYSVKSIQKWIFLQNAELGSSCISFYLWHRGVESSSFKWSVELHMSMGLDDFYIRETPSRLILALPNGPESAVYSRSCSAHFVMW